MNVWLWVYLAGVAVGLWRTDGSWRSKLLFALLWPLGPITFVVVVMILLSATPIAFLGPRPR